MKQKLLIGLWGGVLMFAFIWTLWPRTVWFDPDSQWARSDISDYLYEQVNTLKTPRDSDHIAWVFLDEECFCQSLNQSHIEQVIGKLQHAVDVKVITTPVAFVPSRPAVIVADYKAQRINYAGPFSQGILCGVSGSLLEHLVDNQSLLNAQIINDLQEGCYCPSNPI